jgi:hypothetical protein
MITRTPRPAASLQGTPEAAAGQEVGVGQDDLVLGGGDGLR